MLSCSSYLSNDVLAMRKKIPVVAKLAERFTGNEHTSITYEKAQDLMGAVLYCIEEYDKYGQESGNDAVGAERALRKAGMDIAAPQAYEAGRKLVTARVEKLRLLEGYIL